MNATFETDTAVDIVVVSYASRSTLRACVEPLAGQPGLSVTVVDNASPDESLEVVEDLPLQAVASGGNRGFAAGCNLGWRKGTAPGVLFLNPDARIAPGDVRRLAARLGDSRVGIVAPRIVGEHGELQFSVRRFPTLRSTYSQAVFLHRLFPASTWSDEVMRDPAGYAMPRAVEWASGACLLVRRSVLEVLGGWDEEFFMYCEDTDLCRRAAASKFLVQYEPGVSVVHLGGRSAPRASLLPILADSRCRYGRKHQSRFGATLTRAGVALGALTHAIVSRGGVSARIAQLKAIRAALRPSFER